ncbi:hypothetical protein DSM19430T_14070 [Desulfovibrio psychrotolerans]|uniref:Uncharacterized protein n=1 Tax=Desulfovibrio psychrotolerans TaxID=415242 RepID=A0A7J0BSM4_9BACT|nr:hypothetical protein DSM19430T_14070 [Desulfovibrio psychrotolerans]
MLAEGAGSGRDMLKLLYSRRAVWHGGLPVAAPAGCARCCVVWQTATAGAAKAGELLYGRIFRCDWNRGRDCGQTEGYR